MDKPRIVTVLVTLNVYDATTPEDAALSVRKVIENNTDFGADAEPTIGLDALEQLLGDFAAEVSMDLDKGLLGYGKGTVKIARKIATALGLEWK